MSDAATTDPASFRDPSGRVYVVDGRVFRTILPPAREDYEFVRSTSCLDRLIERDLVISAEEVPKGALAEAGADACYLLEHPRLPFISYPFEWSFPALKAAALLTLDIHLEVLQHGVTLSDASAYNVQFQGPNPLFIDYLSFRRYREGEFWSGHRQFCEQFLNPLLLTSTTGVPFQPWYRGAIDGIPATELAPLLPLRRRISWNVMTHVMMQARYSKPAAVDKADRASERKLPLPALKRMLGSIRSWIARLEPSGSRPTVWEGYTAAEGYQDAERRAKHEFVREFSGSARPEVMLDLGCNTGEYAEIALAAGTGSVIGLESDHGALDAAFRRAVAGDLPFLPIYTDVANPSPGGGWLGHERSSLKSRISSDAVLALALVHHLAIGRNIPLAQVVEWIVSLAPTGIIEFVPKADAMVQALLRLREDVFEHYSADVFLDSLRGSARVVKAQEITESGRLLVWFERT
jgi:ribosomal protein L11 methylase PrmA